MDETRLSAASDPVVNSDAERLSLALAAAKLGDWSWDAATDVVTMSPRAAEIFGIAAGPTLTWKEMRTLLHPDDAERARIAVDNAVATRTAYSTEYRVLHAGDVRWVSASGRGVYDNDAGVGMLGVVQDITDQVRTRQRLQLEAESLETINRVGQLLSAQLDLQPLVQSVTDAATELSGAEFGAFFYNVLDDKGESYMLYTLSGVPAEAFARFPMPRSTDVFAPTFRGEGVIRLDDVRKDPRFGKNSPHYGMPKGHLPVVSYLAVPVIGRAGEVIGGLFFGHSQPGIFDERAERIVTGLAGQAATAVDNARLFEAAQRSRRVAEETNLRMNAVLDAIPDIFTATDAEGRYSYANAAARRVWQQQGRSTDVIGRSRNDVFPELKDSEFDRAFEKTMTTRQPVALETFFEPFQRWFDVRYFPMPDGGVCTVSHDITDQKRAAEAVARSESRFREVASTNSSLTLYEQDRDLRYTWVFPRHTEHFDSVGRTDEELLPPSEGAKLSQLKRACIETGRSGRHEISVTLPTGEHFYDVVVEPRRDASGAIVGVGGVAVDITERKNNERLLQRAQEAASDSEARLRDADRRKDEFLAMLAHELRNPLAPIRTGLHLLGADQDSPDAIARVRSMMERQVGHIVRLVDDLLDVSRITAGKIQLQREPIAIADLIEQAIEANRTAITASELVLHSDLATGSASVVVDPTRMVQVVANVLNNAVKFSRAKGHITLTSRLEGDEAVITIADQGAGIAPTTLPRIFELFVQGEASAARSHGGLGIGLALARTLIDMHGGSIEAASDGVGRGSMFTIRVPGVTAPTVASSQTLDSATHMIDRRVLVVDDNEDSVELLVLLVERRGGEARKAGDGESAIAEAARFQPDFILLDIGLPGIDGYETCRRLRQQHGSRPMIVALTGWGQEQDKRRAREAGFDLHLTKPVDPVALEALLASPTAKS